MGSLFVYDDDFVATLGSLCGHFWHLGRLWGHFGITLGLLWEHLRHVGVTLGALWGQVWVSLGSVWVSVDDFGSLDGHFAIIVDSPWVYEGPLSKNIHFPTNGFIKMFGGLWVDLGLLWDRFRHMKVNLGPLWGHFGATLGI